MDLGRKVCSRIQQRYLLTVMCMLGFLFATLNRFFLDLFMKEQFLSLKKKSFLPTCTQESHEFFTCGREEFLWGNAIQGHIHAGWMYGNILGLIPLALLTEKFGAKTIFGFSIFVPGICSALTPICARSSPNILVFIRVIAGFSTSTQFLTQAWMAVRWFPLRHRGLMLSIVYTGVPLGVIIPLLCNYLAITVFCMNWSFVSYVYSIVTVLFAFLWYILIWDDPFDHPYISDNELLLLAHVHEPELEPGWRWPWKSMFQTKDLWLLSVAYVGQTCFFVFACYGLLLLYYPQRLGYCLINHMDIGSMIFLSMAAGMVAGGLVGDWVVSARHWLNITQITKTCLAINCILGPLFLIAVIRSACDLSLATFSLIGAFICEGFAFANCTVSCLHMAPNFIATSMALISLPSLIISPVVFGINVSIINTPIKNNWETAAYFNAVLSVFATAVFLQCGKIEPQLWNYPQNIKEKDNVVIRPSKTGLKDWNSKRQPENIPRDVDEEPGDSGVRAKTSKHSQTIPRSDVLHRTGSYTHVQKDA